MNRAKNLVFITDQDTGNKRLVFLYQSTRYKQFLREIRCLVSEGLENIRLNNTRCIGRCQQEYGSQLVIALQSSPLGLNLTMIDVKIGCKFVPSNDETDGMSLNT